MGQLDDRNWMHYKPIPLLEDNNITTPLQKGNIGSEWFTNEENFLQTIQEISSTLTRLTLILKAMHV